MSKYLRKLLYMNSMVSVIRTFYKKKHTTVQYLNACLKVHISVSTIKSRLYTERECVEI